MSKNPKVSKVFEELKDIEDPEMYIVIYANNSRLGGDFANMPSWSTMPYMDYEVKDLSSPSPTAPNIVRLDIELPPPSEGKKLEESEEKEICQTATRKKSTLPVGRSQSGQVHQDSITSTTKKSEKKSARAKVKDK